MVMVKPALAYLDVIAADPRRVRRARRGVPRERRVRDGEGRRAARLDRRRRGRARAPARDQARRRRHRPHVLRPRGRRARSTDRSDDREPTWFERAQAAHPGRRQLAGARVRLGRRRPVLRRARRRARTSSTPTAASTSTTCSRGARRSSVTRIPRSSRRCSAPRPTGTSYGAPTPREVELAEAICDAGADASRRSGSCRRAPKPR